MFSKNTILSFFLSFFVVDCSQQKTSGKTRKTLKVRNFKKFVKRNWDYNYKRGYVITHNFFNEPSGWKSEYNEELKKLDILQVKKLFDEPRIRQVIQDGVIKWFYFREKQCIPFDKTFNYLTAILK